MPNTTPSSSSDAMAVAQNETQQPSWSDLPSQDWNTLEEMYNNGELSGVPPEYLAGIFQAEGSNTSDAVNSAGYGGYFGLPTSYDYESFSQQAQAASQVYAQGLKESGGDPIGAESYYQTGYVSPYSSSGPTLFQEWGLGNTTVDPSTVSTGGGAGTASLTSKTKSTDIFTQAMVSLDHVFHPNTSGITNTITLGVPSTMEMIFARGVFALGFATIGFLAAIGVISGGRVSGKDLPGLVAGFIAGPEIGAANALAKVGVGRSAQNVPIQNQRLQITQQRQIFQQQRIYQSQQRINQASINAANVQKRHQQSLNYRWYKLLYGP